jgi:SUR7/PalI family
VASPERQLSQDGRTGTCVQWGPTGATTAATYTRLSLDPPSHRNFDTTQDIPKQFIGTGKYFYMTRFMFAFMLIALFFAVCSFFTGMLALGSRIGSYLSGLLGMLALFFQSINASLMT